MQNKERKGFNFYKSYFDVYNELSKKDRLFFIDALLNKEFNNIEPELSGISKLAYIGVKHSVDAQVNGFISKYGTFGEGVAQGVAQGVEDKDKGKDNIELTIPDIQEFMLYIKDYLKKEPDRYKKVRTRMIDTYNAWKLNNWKDGNDKKIKNWKTKALMQLRYIK